MKKFIVLIMVLFSCSILYAENVVIPKNTSAFDGSYEGAVVIDGTITADSAELNGVDSHLLLGNDIRLDGNTTDVLGIFKSTGPRLFADLDSADPQLYFDNGTTILSRFQTNLVGDLVFSADPSNLYAGSGLYFQVDSGLIMGFSSATTEVQISTWDLFIAAGSNLKMGNGYIYDLHGIVEMQGSFKLGDATNNCTFTSQPTASACSGDTLATGSSVSELCILCN